MDGEEVVEGVGTRYGVGLQVDDCFARVGGGGRGCCGHGVVWWCGGRGAVGACGDVGVDEVAFNDEENS